MDSRSVWEVGRSGALAVAVAALLLLATVSPVYAAGFYYAGYQTHVSTHFGVSGSISQQTTNTLTSPQHHVSWLNVCGNGTCAQWVQTGLYQGWLGVDPEVIHSASAVHIYAENVDQCSRLVEQDSGAPSSQQNWVAFYLNYDGAGVHYQTCNDGTTPAFYIYEYRNGSATSVPFFYGQIHAQSGKVYVSSELYPNQQVPMGYDYFGCGAFFNCDGNTYALHLYDGSYSLWTNDYAKRTSGKPPYLHTYHTPYAFRTCGTTSC